MPDKSAPASGCVSDHEFSRLLTAAVSAAATRACADGPSLWNALANTGLLADLYEPGVQRHRTPAIARRLRALICTLDAHCPMGAVLSVCVQAASAVPLLFQHVPKLQPALLDGSVTVALAVTDTAVSGSAVAAMRTTLKLENDVAILDGAKSWITNATTASHLLVLAAHSGTSGVGALSWVLIPAGHPGLTIKPADTTALTGAGLGHCEFDAVTVPIDHIIGGIGRGLPVFTTHVTMERWCSVWWSLAVARRALITTREHLASRDAGNGSLWSQQAVRMRFGDCLLQFHLAKSLSEHDAGSGASAATQAMIAKVAAGRMLTAVLTECAQLQGAAGFTRDGIQSLRADAAMFTLAGGAGDSLLLAATADADRLLG